MEAIRDWIDKYEYVGRRGPETHGPNHCVFCGAYANDEHHDTCPIEELKRIVIAGEQFSRSIPFGTLDDKIKASVEESCSKRVSTDGGVVPKRKKVLAITGGYR